MQYQTQSRPIILVRKQFQQLLSHSNKHEPLRNQLIIDLPTQMGLRTKEIRLLHWQDLDIDSGHMTVCDAKSRHLYPIPLSYELARKFEGYRRGHEGIILRRLLGHGYSTKMKGQPMRNKTIWDTWKRVAQRAHVQNWQLYNPRLGRHYFAAMWNLQGGNIEVLRRILRHKSLQYTQIYLSKLIFFEDVQAEYNRIHKLPIGGNRKKMSYPEYEQVQLREECLSCPAVNVCKYKEDFSSCEACSGCKFRGYIMASVKERVKT